MNWKSYVPSTWKIATMKSLIKQGFLISSTPTALECELKHIKKVFVDINDYPERLVAEIKKIERNHHLE